MYGNLLVSNYRLVEIVVYKYVYVLLPFFICFVFLYYCNLHQKFISFGLLPFSFFAVDQKIWRRWWYTLAAEQILFVKVCYSTIVFFAVCFKVTCCFCFYYLNRKTNLIDMCMLRCLSHSIEKTFFSLFKAAYIKVNDINDVERKEKITTSKKKHQPRHFFFQRTNDYK